MQRRGVQPGPAARDHDRLDVLFAHRRRHAEHERLRHIRMCLDQALEFPRAHVLAAPANEVRQAVDVVHPALFVLVGEVAGSEPAVLPGRAGRLLVAFVAQKQHVGPARARNDLAPLAGRQGRAVLRRDPDLEVGRWHAARPDGLRDARNGHGEGLGLGHSVGVRDSDAEALLQRAVQRRRHRAEDAESQVLGGRAFVGGHRLLPEDARDGGEPGDHRRAAAPDLGPEARRREAGDESERSAGDRGAHGRVQLSGDVKEGQPRVEDIVGRHPDRFREIGCAAAQLVVRNHRRLGAAGRARGEHDGRGIARAGIGARPGRRPQGLATADPVGSRGAVHYDECANIRVGQVGD